MQVCVWGLSGIIPAYTRHSYQPAALLSDGARPVVITEVNKYISMVVINNAENQMSSLKSS